MPRVRGLGLIGMAAVLAAPSVWAAQGSSVARASGIPINHVVVLMQENRSFDHYLGQLHFEGQNNAAPEPPGASNPNPLNPALPPIHAFHETRYCEPADLNHSWNGAHAEYHNGLMDGFTAANENPSDPTGSRTMGFYDQTDLPYYYALDNAFAIGDQYFQSVLSQTFPNRFYLLAGTSFGHIRNDLAPPDGFTQKTIFENLDAAGISWRIYYSQIPFAFEFVYVRNHSAGHVFPIGQYYADAAAGNLPQVSFVDPIFVASNTTENDEHPPSNIQVGENFASNVINSLMTSPNWRSSALFLTYDEDGGFFDHVPPPAAVSPDNIQPMYQSGDVQPANPFGQYGFRVPITVVSPWSNPHSVSHVVNDHTSILKFMETRFGLPPLTSRDAAANAMLEFFDFSRPHLLAPPSLPPAPIDSAHLSQCASAPSNTGV